MTIIIVHICIRVYSGYCMQEFDVAFHHNIMVKRKKRLIVLMALDRPTALYDNDASDKAALRQYLRQYTYIDYTTNDWLEKVLYGLPLCGLLQRSGPTCENGYTPQDTDTDRLQD